ncbi:diphthamide biosynthesis protein 2 [Lophiostoma macrostomum CBS 122681]|uniref:2-(3-amino-3-carboxypropyl)histidine synthase subunit 2 n=1 Tax=Lophiostoma macrostomum CBS 122681 TaxID=1314788 RepID=A0A6A6T7N5_9PLEO|nr:diphthamide biosynthesis protein 2 [Lophiostoma macrostomum CBS 122681]
MTTTALETAPVLSTPDTHIFGDPTPVAEPSSLQRLPDEQIALTYEIERTVREIREGRWKRIALQFPDQMLVDAPRVYEALTQGLGKARRNVPNGTRAPQREENGTTDGELASGIEQLSVEIEKEPEERLFILADTSYGACCVDEVAAEHVDADVVVHYGRSCLSPPSRLPVIYVFTERPLDLNQVVSTFKRTYPDRSQKVILMADIPYSHHIPDLHARLESEGYDYTYATSIIHKPSSLLPNRTIPPDATDPDALREYQLFHISSPPTSLLLTLSSRVGAIHIYPTDTPSPTAIPTSSAMTLRRRYALLTSLSTVSVFGILINTLSVKNYMHMLSHVQSLISAAGKKAYTFVVGKVNAAKVANFSEVGGWVVIGCWESSLIESSEFWKPIITPFELRLALQGDEERVWTGEWTGDFMAVLGEKEQQEGQGDEQVTAATNGRPTQIDSAEQEDQPGDYDSEEESAPPEFDLRTGRYVSHSRPMRSSTSTSTAHAHAAQNGIAGASTAPSSNALTKRANGDLAQVGGVVSPGAEFLRSQRTWQGLGSDYTETQDGEGDGNGDGHAARMEEGRRGIASRYVVGEDERQH